MVRQLSRRHQVYAEIRTFVVRRGYFFKLSSKLLTALRAWPSTSGGGTGSLRNVGRGLLDGFHELGKPAAAEEHVLFAAVEHAGEEGALELEHFDHPVLDRALRDEIDDAHRLPLAESMHSADALLQHGGIPR